MSIFDTSPAWFERDGEAAPDPIALPRRRSPEAEELLDRIDELIGTCNEALGVRIDFPGIPEAGHLYTDRQLVDHINQSLETSTITDPADLTAHLGHATLQLYEE